VYLIVNPNLVNLVIQDNSFHFPSTTGQFFLSCLQTSILALGHGNISRSYWKWVVKWFA